MSHPMLTDADGIALKSFYDAGWAQDRTDEIEIGRWSKYGHDRLYINSGIPKAEKYSLYVDLETHEIVSDNDGKHSGGSVTINGDTATIIIEESGDKEHEIVVSLTGDAFETDEPADEPEEIVTDGGHSTGELAVGDTYETEENGQWEIVDERDASEGVPEHSYCVRAVDAPGAEQGHEEWVAAETVLDSLTRIVTDDSDGEPVADGGKDTTAHVTDDTIKAAIEKHDGPLDDERTATVAEVRDALAWLQESIEAQWGEWCDNIEHDEARVVYEDTEMIICSTGEQNVPYRDLRNYYPGELDGRVPDIVSAIHHELARDRCDYDWGYEYPIVIQKGGLFRSGQLYVEAVINSFLRRGLSPGQAWAYYGSELRNNSNNSWATRCGYSDHSAVSEPLRKAKSKL